MTIQSEISIFSTCFDEIRVEKPQKAHHTTASCFSLGGLHPKGLLVMRTKMSSWPGALVGGWPSTYPSEKWWLRQLGWWQWWHSQYMENNPNIPNHQQDMFLEWWNNHTLWKILKAMFQTTNQSCLKAHFSPGWFSALWIAVFNREITSRCFIILAIWGFPEMGEPLNHPF